MPARPGGGAGPGPGGSRRTERRSASTAPRSRRTSRVAPDDAASQTAKRRGSLTTRALVLMLVVAVLGVSYASSIRAWLNQRSEQQTLAAQIASQKAAIAELRTEKARWQDPAYIEEQARLRFGWVMPGERSYRVIGLDGKVLTAGHDVLTTPDSSATTTKPPWWSAALDSVRLADSPPAVKTNPVQHQPKRTPAQLIKPTGQ